jgi:hypothetical protein
MFKKSIFKQIVLSILLAIGFVFIAYLIKNKENFLLNKKNFTKEISEKNINLTVNASALSKKSFGSLFHGSNYFWNKGVKNRYKAIKIDIKNDSEHNFVLDRNSCNLTLIDPSTIQKKLTSKFNLIPFVASGATSALCSFGLGLAMLPTMLASGAVATAASFANFDKSEERLNQNIKKYSYDVDSAVLIPKTSVISRILFIENKNLKSDFNIKLFDLNLEKYFDFTVKLGL